MKRIKKYLIVIGCLLTIDTFAQLPLLDSLSLEHADEFTNIDSALKNPDQVIKLVLRKSKLTVFPKEILQFKNLQYLDLSKNKITELPQEIGQLKDLQKLVLSKNHLTSLPKEIGQLKNLRELNINQNDIEYLPAEIGKLENLVYIDMWSNNLNRMPEEIEDLKKLRVLDLRVILLDDEDQQHIQSLLPHTTIYFSPSCKCKQ